MEDDTVGAVDLDLGTAHDDEAFFQIRGKKGHGTGFMIQAHQMLIIREKRHILGIVAAHRKAEQLLQFPVSVIDLLYRCRIISRIGADQILLIQ